MGDMGCGEGVEGGKQEAGKKMVMHGNESQVGARGSDVAAKWKSPPIYWGEVKAQLAIQFQERFIATYNSQMAYTQNT